MSIRSPIAFSRLACFSHSLRFPRCVAVACLAALLLGACGPSGGPGVYRAHGVVEDVNAEYGQVVIAHDDVRGLMPAMTMSFDVPDPELLATLSPGQVIDFEIEFTGSAYRVVSADVRGQADALGHGSAASIAGVRDGGEAAPPFSLIDHAGNRLALEDLHGRAVLLDFVYTRCPGPCPILTGLHVEVQKQLDPALRERVHFVSITLDPVNDTPPAMRRYAQARGADLSDWSFLTGPAPDVEAVIRDYGVGSARQPDGTIAHVVVTFLIDGEGRIARRFIGLDGHDPSEVAKALERLAASLDAPPADLPAAS